MAALEFSERTPMPIEQSRKDFRFYFALLQFFVALLVARVVFAIRINRRYEYDVLPIRRPDAAVRSGRNLRVRFEIDIYAIEHHPFAIRRRHWRADALKSHHVLERERVFAC